MGVVDGVVDFLGLELIVLQKTMVWLFGKKERGETQGVDNGVAVEMKDAFFVRHGKVLQVVPDDVVATKDGATPNELVEFENRMGVQNGTIFADGPNVSDFLAVDTYFGIDKYYHGVKEPSSK